MSFTAPTTSPVAVRITASIFRLLRSKRRGGLRVAPSRSGAGEGLRTRRLALVRVDDASSAAQEDQLVSRDLALSRAGFVLMIAIGVAAFTVTSAWWQTVVGEPFRSQPEPPQRPQEGVLKHGQIAQERL